MYCLSLDMSEQLQCYITCSFHHVSQSNATIAGRPLLPICPHKQSIVTQSIYVASNVPNSCKLFHAICSTNPLVNLSPMAFAVLCKKCSVKIFM